MKILLPLLVLAVTACGKYDIVPGGSKVGEALTITSISDFDRSNLTSICNALGSKSATTGANLSFQSFEGDCTGNTISNGPVQTTIQKVGSDYFLVRKLDNGAFIFPDLESRTKGLLETVCPNINGVDNNPVPGASEAVTYNTTGINQEDCASANEEICVEVKRASLVNGSYIVHTKEYMRVKVSDNAQTGKLGYFTSRKKVTKSYCGLNEQLVFKADLK